LSEQAVQRCNPGQLDAALRTKGREDGERCEIRVSGLAYGAFSRNPPKASIDHDHFAVQIGESAEAEVSMALQFADGNHTF
jgi:hypothetical protein